MGNEALAPAPDDATEGVGAAELAANALPTGSLVARNSLWNLAGQAGVVVVGIAAMPWLVSSLGPNRVGLFSIGLALIGYLTILDLGLGSALARFVAEAVGRGDRARPREFLGTAVALQGAFGLVGGMTLAVLTPWIVGRWLSLAGPDAAEARQAFYWAAASVPIVLLTIAFSGALAGMQRFGPLNKVRFLTGALTYALAVVAAVAGMGIGGVMAAYFVARVVALVALGAVGIRLFGPVGIGIDASAARELLAFGGWVAGATAVAGLIAHADRFVVATLGSPARVAFYSVPMEAAAKLVLIPTSISLVLLPAFASMLARGEAGRLASYFARSLKYTVVGLGPVLVGLAIFSGELLSLWLGTNFEQESTKVLQIVALGVLGNAFAVFPHALLLADRRARAVATAYAVELPLFVAALVVLVGYFGIEGAAWAWTLRSWADAILLLAAVLFRRIAPPSSLLRHGSGLAMVATFGFAVATVQLDKFLATQGIAQRIFGFFVASAVFATASWRLLFDDVDRGLVGRTLRDARPGALRRLK